MVSKKQAAAEEKLITLLRTQAQKWLTQPNVTSVGVGYKVKGGKVTDELCIQFTVGQKLETDHLKAEGITALPTSFTADDGTKVPVDVIARRYQPTYEIVSDPVAEVKTEALTPRQQRRSRLDPIQPGISVSHINGTAGTIGAIVYDNQTGQPYVLSNWHVLHGPGEAIGDTIVQPGPFDDGNVNDNRLGRLVNSHLGLAGDCAIASIEGRRFSEEVLELGVSPKQAGKVHLNDHVVKSGRTTAVTHGIVQRVGVVVNINYGGSVGVRAIGGFEIGPNPAKPARNGEVSMGGDSGSIWLVDTDGRDSDVAVGLHFAGETDPDPNAEHAIACNIHSVLRKLDVSFAEKDEVLMDDEALWNEVLALLNMLFGRINNLEQQLIQPSSGALPAVASQAQAQLAGQRAAPEGLGLPVYGNWCGPGHGSGQPIDDVDRACMNHDQCYDQRGYLDCSCDEQLIQSIDQALGAGNVRSTGRIIAPLIRGWFANVQPCIPRTGSVGPLNTVTAVTRSGTTLWKSLKRWF